MPCAGVFGSMKNNGLGTCGWFQNVFFSIYLFSHLSNTQKFLLSQIDYWKAPFEDLFSTILMKIQKCDFGAHPTYWTNVRFYKHFSLGRGRCCDFWGFPKNDFTISIFCIFQRSNFFYCLDCHTGRLLFSMIFLKCFSTSQFVQLSFSRNS